MTLVGAFFSITFFGGQKMSIMLMLYKSFATLVEVKRRGCWKQKSILYLRIIFHLCHDCWDEEGSHFRICACSVSMHLSLLASLHICLLDLHGLLLWHAVAPCFTSGSCVESVESLLETKLRAKV